MLNDSIAGGLRSTSAASEIRVELTPEHEKTCVNRFHQISGRSQNKDFYRGISRASFVNMGKLQDNTVQELLMSGYAWYIRRIVTRMNMVLFVQTRV